MPPHKFRFTPSLNEKFSTARDAQWGCDYGFCRDRSLSLSLSTDALLEFLSNQFLSLNARYCVKGNANFKFFLMKDFIFFFFLMHHPSLHFIIFIGESSNPSFIINFFDLVSLVFEVKGQKIDLISGWREERGGLCLAHLDH